MPVWAGSVPGSADLVQRLGAQRVDELDVLLRDRALTAAAAATPGEVRAAELGDGDLAAGLAGAADRVWGDGDGRGSLVVIWPDLPRWRPAHIDAALSDLADGCDLALGPVFDGGFYLLALARPLPGLFELPAESWRSPDAMATTFALAAKDHVQVGLLRAERALRTPADVAAALADPMLDEKLRRLLSG